MSDRVGGSRDLGECLCDCGASFRARTVRAPSDDARASAASELLVVQLMPSREAAYGFANIGAGLFDLLHVEPS